MMRFFELLTWRLTGYRELSKLLHAHCVPNNALTPLGEQIMQELILTEAALLPIGRHRPWYERILF